MRLNGSRRRGLLTLVVAALMSVAAACGDGDGEPGTKELETVSIAFAAFQDVQSVYVGVEKGFYADEGIKLDIQPTDWPGGNEALIGGHVDLAGFADSEIVVANSRGIDVTVALPLFQFAGGAAMYDADKHDWHDYEYFLEQTDGDRREALRRTLEQMQGAKIGTLIPGGEYGSLLFMSRYTGLDFKDFDLVNLTQEDLPPALFSGSIDVMMGGIPQRLTALREGYATLFDTGALPEAAAHAGFGARLDWAKENFDLLVRMQRVIFRTLTYIKDHPTESFEIIARRLKDVGTTVKPEELPMIWDKMEFFQNNKREYMEEVASAEGEFYWKDRYESVIREFKRDGTIKDLDVPLEDLNFGLKVVKAT